MKLDIAKDRMNIIEFATYNILCVREVPLFLWRVTKILKFSALLTLFSKFYRNELKK